jgi:hypothetical protein
MNEEEDPRSPSSAKKTGGSEVSESEHLGKTSFPASDSPAVWIWEVPKVVGKPSPSHPPREPE